MFGTEQLGQLNERDVHLRFDRAKYEVVIRFNPPRTHIAALRLSPRRSCLLPFANPADRAGYSNAKSLGCRAS